MFCLNKIIFCGDIKSYFSNDTFPVFPCKVFSVYSNRTEDDEALFAANLVISIIEFANLENIIKPMTIGVFVPFATSKPGIITAINRR